MFVLVEMTNFLANMLWMFVVTNLINMCVLM